MTGQIDTLFALVERSIHKAHAQNNVGSELIRRGVRVEFNRQLEIPFMEWQDSTRRRWLVTTSENLAREGLGARIQISGVSWYFLPDSPEIARIVNPWLEEDIVFPAALPPAEEKAS